MKSLLERPDDQAGHEGHSHEHGGIFGMNTELIFALICGALLGAGALAGKLGLIDRLPLILYVSAYVFGGWFTTKEAVTNIRQKRFEIDSLMLLAAVGAASIGAWAEGALLLFLFSLGHSLESYAMGRAKKAIEALSKLAPATAIVRRANGTVEMPVELLVPGDVVIVRPNDRLPADGFVVVGSSSINQAPVTGESVPVDKQPVPDAELARSKPDAVDAASKVFAGTINGETLIEVEVTRRSTESTLARVIKMVSEAEVRKSPTQRFTDRFQRIFVPLVLLLVVGLLFAGIFLDEPFRDSFYRAMAVLVAASPCALAIATPSAILSGIARAARGGVLIKGGAPLEELGSLNAMAFDKTGILTEGRPRITDVIPIGGTQIEDLLNVAIAVESMSDHPLAAAIVRDGEEMIGTRRRFQAKNMSNMIGRGVRAELDGQFVWIGKVEMFGTNGIPALSKAALEAAERLRQSGRTTMVVRRADKDLGAIGLLDTPREGAKEALQKLREMGIERMVMISGDHNRVAEAVAKQVGLDEAWGDLMPEDKVKAIKNLRLSAKVAMVGDGVNDAPAMASSSVGIAMGAAGSDVALETADIALMADDIRQLPFAVGLSRHTRSIIHQNLFVSLGIGAAVAIHEGSTLLVVFNALRLLAYRRST
ncbi:heavy metal translocating P-type ATPase [Pseudomonas rhodesiae]|uniref:heavy metal translocating P-type ATPase n=1 Tax=Pseudomonas rhodesiae TaxID=76760 RepID=UPI0032B243BA